MNYTKKGFRRAELKKSNKNFLTRLLSNHSVLHFTRKTSNRKIQMHQKFLIFGCEVCAGFRKNLLRDFLVPKNHFDFFGDETELKDKVLLCPLPKREMFTFCSASNNTHIELIERRLIKK